MTTSLPRRLSEALIYGCNTVGDELFPVVVWLTVFGATRVAPSLILHLSMAVPQTMDFPQLLLWRRRATASDGVAAQLSADQLAAQLAEWIQETPSGGSRSFASLPDASPEWTRRSHRVSEVLVSLLTYPQRMAAYLLFQHRQRSASSAGGAALPSGSGGGRPVVVRLLLRLVTSFTSTWVHATGTMLFDTVVTYMSTRIGSWGSGGTAGFALGNGGPGRGGSSRRLSSGWRDLLVASCVSTGLNFLLQTYWVDALTSLGELRTQTAPARRSSSSAGQESGGGGGSDFTHLLLSTLSRLGSKDTLYRLGRMALQPQSSSPPPPPPSPPRAPPQSMPTGASATPAPPPARVYICGGNAFVFALSGFRFAFYRDPQQLTTAASNCVTDALDLLLRQARQRAAAQSGRAASPASFMDGLIWQPPASAQTAGLATSNDVVLAPAASLQLLPIYLVNFAVGAGVGVVWRERRHFLAAGRRVPLVRELLAVVSPVPPPPLRLPEALQELSPECHVLLVYASGQVEVVGEEALAAAPLVKPEAAAPSSPVPSGTSGAALLPTSPPVRARIVAAQELFCPIKRTLMSDPVQTVDGFTYDRDGIEEWLGAHDTAPLTNLHLDSTGVRVNWQARRQIEELVAQYATVMTPAE